MLEILFWVAWPVYMIWVIKVIVQGSRAEREKAKERLKGAVRYAPWEMRRI